MQAQPNDHSLHSQRVDRQTSEFSLMWMPSVVDSYQHLPSLNASSYALVPTGEQYVGVFEVLDETKTQSQNQSALYWVDTSVDSSIAWARQRMTQNIWDMNLQSDFHSSRQLQLNYDLPRFSNRPSPGSLNLNKTLMLRHDISHSKQASLQKWKTNLYDKNNKVFPLPQVTRAIHNTEISVPTPMPTWPSKETDHVNLKQVIVKDPQKKNSHCVPTGSLCSSLKIKMNSNVKNLEAHIPDKPDSLNTSLLRPLDAHKKPAPVLLAQSFWAWGLSKDQARLVEKVLTPNNVRFIRNLRDYPYAINETVDASTQLKVYKYVCKYKGCCNKEFNRPWNLLDHCRMHFGVKPFEWHIWGRRFTQKGNRNKHVTLHK